MITRGGRKYYLQENAAGVTDVMCQQATGEAVLIAYITQSGPGVFWVHDTHHRNLNYHKKFMHHVLDRDYGQFWTALDALNFAVNWHEYNLPHKKKRREEIEYVRLVKSPLMKWLYSKINYEKIAKPIFDKIDSAREKDKKMYLLNQSHFSWCYVCTRSKC